MRNLNWCATFLCLTTVVLAGAPASAQERNEAARQPAATGEEAYLARRVEVLRERLELTEELGDLEVELLQLRVEGHDRRVRHLEARQEVRERAIEAAERGVAHREQLRAKGLVSERDIEDARSVVGEARSALLELAVEREELEVELVSTKLAVKRRQIESRLAQGEIRLELLEAEHDLETRRAFRARFLRDRGAPDRDRDEAATDAVDEATFEDVERTE